MISSETKQSDTTDQTDFNHPVDQKCVYVIFNPVSGTSDPEERQKIILEALAEHGYQCQFFSTTKEEGADKLVEKALDLGADLIAVSGGDGTVMEAMSALVGKSIPLAVLPAGTGNLLSVNLGIPTTVPEAVHVALSGKQYQLDLARTSDGRYFGIMGGLGLDAQMIADAGRDAKKKLGVFAYFYAAIKNLPRPRTSVEITLDDKPPIRRRAKTVFIANMGKITGGLEAMPTASSNDGLLDIGVIRSQTLLQGLRLLGYALIGRTHADPDFDVQQAKKIKIRTLTPQPLQFDGEEEEPTRELIIEVVPKAVILLVPENSSVAQDSQAPPEKVAEQESLRRLLVPASVLLLAIAGVIWAKRRRG